MSKTPEETPPTPQETPPTPQETPGWDYDIQFGDNNPKDTS